MGLACGTESSYTRKYSEIWKREKKALLEREAVTKERTIIFFKRKRGIVIGNN